MVVKIALLLGVIALLLVTLDASNHRRGFMRRRTDESLVTSDAEVEQTVNSLETIRLTTVDTLTSCSATMFGVAQLDGLIYVGCYDDVSDPHWSRLLVHNPHNFSHQDTLELSFPRSVVPWYVRACHKTHRLFLLALDRVSIKSQIWEVNPCDGSTVKVADDLIFQSYFSVSHDGAVVVANGSEVLVYDGSDAWRLASRTRVQATGETLSVRDVVQLESGNFLAVVRGISFTADVLEINKNGEIVGSYSENHLPTQPSFEPRSLSLLNDSLALVTDWLGQDESIYVISTDLSRGRLLLRGDEDGIRLPNDFSFDATSGLLIIKTLVKEEVAEGSSVYNHKPKVFRVTFEDA